MASVSFVCACEVLRVDLILKVVDDYFAVFNMRYLQPNPTMLVSNESCIDRAVFDWFVEPLIEADNAVIINCAGDVSTSYKL